MDENLVWPLAVAAILVAMVFANKKVCLWALVKEQMLVFRNDRKKKISLWDIFCFLGAPVMIAVILVYKLEFTIDEDLANLLTTVFSIVLLFCLVSQQS